MNQTNEPVSPNPEIPEEILDDSIIDELEGQIDTNGVPWTQREFSHPERTIRIATSFSGLGAPEKGLERLNLNTKIVFACDIGERYLKYPSKKLREFIRDFSDEDKEKFALSIYENNAAGVDSSRKRKAKKELAESTGEDDFEDKDIKYSPLTLLEVRESLLNDDNKLDADLELTEECIRLICKYKGIDENDTERISEYVTTLYDEKGENFVKASFFANHDIREDAWYTDIRFLNAEKYKGEVDIYVGGSPCQSYSRSGKRLALDDMRGTLFYQFAQRIRESSPKVFIYENVKGMKDKRKVRKCGLQAALEVFSEDLGYKVYWKLLNAKDYGIPQNRERIWVVGFRPDVAPDDFKFPAPIPLTTRMYDYLDEDIPPRSGKVEKPYIRPLTGTECLRLMGFTDFKVAPLLERQTETKRNSIMCSQAGNSMVVECLMALYKQMDITKYGTDPE